MRNGHTRGLSLSQVRREPEEAQADRAATESAANTARKREQAARNDAKTKMKGKNKPSRQHRKKKSNIIEEKKVLTPWHQSLASCLLKRSQVLQTLFRNALVWHGCMSASSDQLWSSILLTGMCEARSGRHSCSVQSWRGGRGHTCHP